MRITFALTILLVAGCAAAPGGSRDAAQPSRESRDLAAALLELDSTMIRRMATRAPCETNDPMPTGRFVQPLPAMPRAQTPVPRMPNLCPVTAGPLAAGKATPARGGKAGAPPEQPAGDPEP